VNRITSRITGIVQNTRLTTNLAIRALLSPRVGNPNRVGRRTPHPIRDL
jgi:hypothetical protein